MVKPVHPKNILGAIIQFIKIAVMADSPGRARVDSISDIKLISKVVRKDPFAVIGMKYHFVLFHVGKRCVSLFRQTSIEWHQGFTRFQMSGFFISAVLEKISVIRS